MNAPDRRVAIVGGGKACLDFLRMIQRSPGSFGLTVVGVADPDPDSQGG